VLLTAFLLAIFALIALIWAVTVGPWHLYQQSFTAFIVLLTTAFLVLIAFGVMGLIITFWWGQPLPVFQSLVMLALNMLFQSAIIFGRWLGFCEDKIRYSLIELNNYFVSLNPSKYRGEEVLLLAPHCLQFNGCERKITRSVSKCNRCRNCQVADLLDLADEYNLRFMVATGGTLARKHINDMKPKIVVAIACERDLISGIQEMYPLPVKGILNERPNGPCFDTGVDLDKVRCEISVLVNEISEEEPIML